MLGAPGVERRAVRHFLKFSREDEAEADYLGVQYLYAAGYDPNGAVSILEKLASLERKSRVPPRASSPLTRPTPARIQNTEREIEQRPSRRDEYVVNTSEYADIRQRVIDGLANRQPTLEHPRESPTLRRDRPE